VNDFAQELLADFLEEARPLAENIGEAVLELEREWEGGGSGEQTLHRIKSNLHTLKGNSGMMGLSPIEQLTHRLEDACAIVSERAGSHEATTIELLLAGADALREMLRLAAASGLDEAHGRTLLDPVEKAIDAMRESSATAPGRPARPATSVVASATSAAPRDAAGNVVRIHYDKLDRMLELVGEAIVAHSSVGELTASADTSQFERAMESLDKSLRDLQQTLIDSRLVPMSLLFRKFPRSVRDQARESGKDVRLELRGEDTTIDKAIMDRLGEPLLHLVRNSIAHGIEPAAERTRLGKPAEGRVELSAEHRSDRVVIAVTDDGRGLDESKIRERAKACGLSNDSTAGELNSHIFLPGFSTADDVSKLSGRGVGLDVVASSIQALGGTVGVSSAPGRGASFRIELPLTLAVLRTLFVDIDDETYALPLSYVQESFRLGDRNPSFRVSPGHHVISWRDQLIPILDGGSVLETAGAGTRGFCVVLSVSGRSCGLLVDGLIGQREVVVKGLDTLLGRSDCLSGITVLGDGRLVFILDAAEIAARAARTNTPRAAESISGAVTANPGEEVR